MIRLSGRDVDTLANPASLIDKIRAVLTTPTIAPRRLSFEHQGSWLGVMPASGLGYHAVKIVGVYPGNPSRGLPLVRGLLVLIDASTGDVLLEAPAEEATGWRTAAASALALHLLGYTGGGTLGIIGAGVQAEYHARVLRRLFEFRKLLVYSRTYSKAQELALRHGGQVVDHETLLRESDVIVAATTSQKPVIRGNLLHTGTYVISVGAPRPVRELDEDTIRRAGCVLVDTREGVFAESDDIPGWVEVVELSEALKGRKCDWQEVAVYKSVGTALLDLAMAIHLYEEAKKKGYGEP